MGTTTQVNEEKGIAEPRYEFRVWGAKKRVSKQLSNLASGERKQHLEDWYLLDGDPTCNTKIRDCGLKVKRLEEERLGFQRWSTKWHHVPTEAPKPFDQVLQELNKSQLSSEDYEHVLAEVFDEFDPGRELRAVFVTKRRRRFRFGSIRAEATSIEIEGRPGSLSTVAIEGPDLHDLIHLRSSLGLAHVPNLPLHLAVDPLRRTG
ncbi:MAG: hypothetical protein ACR2QK_20265 [Acidimicrobiales bacterium]